MPTIRAVIVIQDRKSRAVVQLDKNIPKTEMVESIRIISQHFVPSNKLLTLPLASGNWVVKTLTDLPVGRANLAVLAHKMYPSRKKIALIDRIYEILLEVEDWRMVDQVEDTIKSLIEKDEAANDETRLKAAETSYSLEVETNKKVVADLRERFGGLKLTGNKENDPELGGLNDNNELPGAIQDLGIGPNNLILQEEPANPADPDDPAQQVFDRFQILNSASNKLTECLSKVPELWKKYMWFKFLAVLTLLVLIGVPIILVVIYTQPK